MSSVKKGSEPLENLSSEEIADIVRTNEVLDQELRIEIANKTDGVKNLILAFAFSKSGLSDNG